MKISIAFLSIAFLFLFSCNNQPVYELNFSDFDQNNDSLISENEFIKVFTEQISSTWYGDNEEILNDSNYMAREYKIWDTNDDELLSTEEWKNGYDFSYGDYIISAYDAVDVNGDTYVDYKEYNDALSQTNYYGDMDTNRDNTIDKNEMAKSTFNRWDLNHDNHLQKSEFEKFREFYKSPN